MSSMPIFFGSAEPGQPISYLLRASNLGNSNHVLIRGRPCTIVDSDDFGYEIRVTGTDVFTGRTLEATFPPEEAVDIPYVRETEYQVVRLLRYYRENFIG